LTKDLLDLLRRHQLGVALGQVHQHQLPLADHARELLDQVGQLTRDQREDAEQQQRQEQHEHGEHHPHGSDPRPAVALQQPDEAFEQVGDDPAGQDRREHVAEIDDDQKAGSEQDRQQYHLGVRKGPTEPIGDQAHDARPRDAGQPPRPARCRS
jgi:hypothetical protein